MKVWIKAPNNEPIEADIPNKLKALQGWVGGFIELYYIADDLAIVCNEEGLIRGLPKNCTIKSVPLCGTLIFVGLEGEEFTDCPIGEDEVCELCRGA